MKLLKKLYDMNWPADQSAVLLKRNKHAAAVQRFTPPLSLETEEIIICAFPHQNKNKITRRNSKYCSTYVYGAKLNRIPIHFIFQWQRGNSSMNLLWIDCLIKFTFAFFSPTSFPSKRHRARKDEGKVPKRQLKLNIEVCPRSSAWNRGTEIASSFPLLLMFVTSHHV